MRPWVLNLIPPEDVAIFEIIRQCIHRLPDNRMLKDDQDEVELSCHVLARAVGRVFNLQVEDGFFIVGFEHSWLRTDSGNIIDVYPIAIVGGPILIHSGVPGWTHFLYRPLGSVGQRCPKDYYRETFEARAFRKNVNIVAKELRRIKRLLGPSA